MIPLFYSFKFKTSNEIYPTKWDVLGSINNKDWEEINTDTYEETENVMGAEIIKPFKKQKLFKCIKFQMIDGYPSNYINFCLRKIEIFGQICSYPLETKYNSQIISKAQLFVCILFT